MFYNLEELDITYNSLDKVDLSDNKQLKKLWCGANSFTELNLSNNTELEYLFCENNNLNGDLNLSTNTKLKTLYCNGNNLNKVILNTDVNNIELRNDMSPVSLWGRAFLMTILPSCLHWILFLEF